MKTVGKLYQHYADISDHRQYHFSDVFGLLFFFGKIADVGDFGKAVNEVRDFVAKIRFYCFEIDESVFNDVMEQPGGNAHFIETHFGQYIRDFERMDKIRLTRCALLAAVMQGRKEIRPPDEFNIRFRTVFSTFLMTFSVRIMLPLLFYI